jgi:arylsulfatase
MFYNPGANHAPHHAPQEYIAKYKGKFDAGYEAYRTWVLARMIEKGVLPKGTKLTPINPLPESQANPADAVRPWDSLNADEKKLFSHMAEVWAGFSEYTDAQVGRVIDYLEQSGQRENTMVLYAADNGASGEGTPNGSVNENKFFNGWPDDLQENLRMMEELGSPTTYNHYPTGWAWAFDTPNKMFKRYSLEGGIADPCIIAWPNEMRHIAGGLRDQYHHAVDIVPTMLELTAIDAPQVIKGNTQLPIEGTSMVYCFEEANAPTHRLTQYYAMLGTRAIYHRGWKAVARHGALSGKGDYMNDEWELYHIEEDRSERTNLAAQHPEKVQELIATWFAVAGRHAGFPLDDRTALEILMSPKPAGAAPRDDYVYYPHTAPIPETVAPNIRNRPFAVMAGLEIESPEVGGVIFAHGSRFGGHALFIKDQRLHYAYNFLGIEEQHVVSNTTLPMGNVLAAVEFAKQAEEPKGVARGTLTLYLGGSPVGQMEMMTQPGPFGLTGEGLCIGRDSGDAVSREYSGSFPLRGGRVKEVTFNVRGAHYVDVEKEAQAAFARE